MLILNILPINKPEKSVFVSHRPYPSSDPSLHRKFEKINIQVGVSAFQ